MQYLLGILLLVQASAIIAAPYNGWLIGSFDPTKTQHGVRGTVRAVDSKTILIENFVYDGEGPDAFIWIGTTSSPDSSGSIVPVTPGIVQKLGPYNGQDLQVTLQGSMTLQEYKWISIWCRDFAADFGHVIIPDSFVNPAPHDLGALPTFAHQVRADNVRIEDAVTLTFTNLHYDGGGPDAYFWADTRENPTTEGTKLIWKTGLTNAGRNQTITSGFSGQTITVTMPDGMTIYDYRSFGLWCVAARQNFGSIGFDPATINVPAKPQLDEPTYSNCEVLVQNEFQVQWRINPDDSSISVELAGPIDPGNYLAFGLSGSDSETLMDGSDVTVAWMDKRTMSPMVVDYNLQSKAQCSVNDGRGACPDDTASVGGTNDVMLGDLLFDYGVRRISYKRPLNTSDPRDKVIPTNRSVFISWAIGPINPDGRVAKHVKAPTGNVEINFGRESSVCPRFEDSSSGPQLPPWPVLTIEDETNFRVEIGQSGGVRGYTGITGKTGWGIAWYVNGLLIPEITVERGVTYTFEVYGGNDSEESAQYHPFYITNDDVGGYVQKSTTEKQRTVIYAGPTEGPFCNWQQTSTDFSSDDFDSFAEYKRRLERVCPVSSTGGGKMTWTPDENTPDVVYYQCYTHRFLGWKINVNSASGIQVSLTLLLAALGLARFF